MKISAFIYSGLCGCCLWAAGCSNEVLDADAEARATFFLTTRAAEDGGTPVAITDKQFTRLLLAERMPEHTTVDGKEELHCALSSRYDTPEDGISWKVYSGNGINSPLSVCRR